MGLTHPPTLVATIFFVIFFKGFKKRSFSQWPGRLRLPSTASQFSLFVSYICTQNTVQSTALYECSQTPASQQSYYGVSIILCQICILFLVHKLINNLTTIMRGGGKFMETLQDRHKVSSSFDLYNKNTIKLPPPHRRIRYRPTAHICTAITVE